MKIKLLAVAITLAFMIPSPTHAMDPCGMVPPIYTGPGSAITRIGLQKTYVFYKDGVETFVIRPGFKGKVDNFGMLIPFPTPPSLRKVPDNVFDHVANAVDPPEVVVDLRMQKLARGMVENAPMVQSTNLQFKDNKSKVTVLKQEAVGMYEVAVLAAGSAESLKKWMDENGYQYPQGMDKVTNEYIQVGWCFVAVKTKVGQKGNVNPRPGQRKINPNLPGESVFDGTVQGMGFRFKTDKLVVPMRLSTFNEGDLRNVVYILTDGPQKIRSIPEEYVVRQVSGAQLVKNLTQPLPLRIIGGTEKDIPQFQRDSLPARRDPGPKNGIAKELFASDLRAVATGNLSLEHEEKEKELLRIGEHFGLRGPEIDAANSAALKKMRDKTTDKGLEGLAGMTLTLVDGDFPRDVLRDENLTFAKYQMPAQRNGRLNYDANKFGPGDKREGMLKIGAIDWNSVDQQIALQKSQTRGLVFTLLGLAMLGTIVTFARRPKTIPVIVLGFVLAVSGVAVAETSSQEAIDDMVALLVDSKSANEAIKSIVAHAKKSTGDRKIAVRKLGIVATQGKELAQRGWAIAALAEIGGTDVDEMLLDIHANGNQEMVVRSWAAAARVSMTSSFNGLVEKANLVRTFPAIGRPIGLRIVEQLKEDGDVEVEKVIQAAMKMPQLQQSLGGVITGFGSEKLTQTMFGSKDNNVRRMAAGYLGSLANQGAGPEVAEVVTSALKFDADAKVVPWTGGALFVPGIQWGKEEARLLVGQMIRWYVWCDVKEKQAEKNQLHNNLRSVGLARAAAYKSPGWQTAPCETWLKTWGEAVGQQEIESILKEQGLEKNSDYLNMIR